MASPSPASLLLEATSHGISDAVRQNPFSNVVINAQQQDLTVNASNATGGGSDLSSIPPEIEEGNVEYKLKLINPSADRFQQLVTQLKWRLGEGNGEAMYELGVADGGLLVGLTEPELAQSLQTLEKMASVVGAEISVVRERQITSMARDMILASRQRRELARMRSSQQNQSSKRMRWTNSDERGSGSQNSSAELPSENDPASGEALGEAKEGKMAIFESRSEITSPSEEGESNQTATDVATTYKVAEVLIRKMKDSYHFLEVRIAFLGTTDAGKSTLLGYLSHGQLDNGRGKSRLNLLRHRHEIETGRSSSISHTVIGFNSKGTLLNHNSNSDAQQSLNINSAWTESHIVDQSSKIVMLIDTCGHSKYLKTTIQGISAYKPDYACLVLDGNAGDVDATTKELLGCAMVMCVPVFVVVTKVDIPNDLERSRLKGTLESLLKILMLPGSAKIPVVMQTEDDVVVAGENLELLVKFLNLLPSRATNEVAGVSTDTLLDRDAEFHIEEMYSVPDVGTVVGGRLVSGQISLSESQRLMLGPYPCGRFDSVEVISIHRQRRPVKVLRPGQSGTLALANVNRDDVRKGMVILERSEGVVPPSFIEFEATMLVLYTPAEYLLVNLLSSHPTETEEEPPSTSKKRKHSFRLSPVHRQSNSDGDTLTSVADAINQIARGVKASFGTVHIGSITQPGQLLGFIPDGSKSCSESIKSVQSGDRILVRYRLRYPEYLTTGTKVFFRDGDRGAKMIGEIARLG